MKVSELIRKLQNCDQDAEVLIDNNRSEREDPYQKVFTVAKDMVAKCEVKKMSGKYHDFYQKIMADDGHLEEFTMVSGVVLK